MKLHRTPRGWIEVILTEYENAAHQFSPFHSAHEGFAILKEEVDELWEAVKLNQNNPLRRDAIEREAIQVGAMALRILYDCCKKGLLQ